ncbi:hypothetical protein KP509_13G079100 [Ceratopteris richardii]|uniref:Homeobox domain-containing protein n=1 Tax=Ceratopteris richardii TaxID=49495 RepID=A0A8T2TKB2_CERRI|nr:hypothetical protein KP509_13G079100 [Ceratopteris richardii]
MGPSPKRGYYAAFTDMADEDTVVEEEIAGGVVLKKRRLTMEQVRFLESSFESENKLEPERKAQIAQRLGLQPRQVAVWFQNRRARSKSKQLERDFLALKADYEAVLVENQKLQAEVDRLLAQLREENVPMQNLRTLDTKTATSTKDALTSGSNVSSASNRGSPAPMSSKAVEDEADAEASTASGEAPLEAGGGDEEEEQLSACTLKQEIASSILPLHLQLPSVIAKVADKSTAAASEAFFPDDIHMLANSVHHAYAHQLLDLYADSLGLYENGLFITSLEEPWGGS